MLVARDAKRLTQFERASAYFYPDGKPIKAGNILKNPAMLKHYARLHPIKVHLSTTVKLPKILLILCNQLLKQSGSS